MIRVVAILAILIICEIRPAATAKSFDLEWFKQYSKELGFEANYTNTRDKSSSCFPVTPDRMQDVQHSIMHHLGKQQTENLVMLLLGQTKKPHFEYMRKFQPLSIIEIQENVSILKLLITTTDIIDMHWANWNASKFCGIPSGIPVTIDAMENHFVKNPLKIWIDERSTIMLNAKVVSIRDTNYAGRIGRRWLNMTKSVGELKLAPVQAELTLTCNFDALYYPFDTQVCILDNRMTPVMKHIVDVFNYCTIVKQSFKSHPMWETIGCDSNVTYNEQRGYFEIRVTFIFSRQAREELLKFHMPMLMLGLMLPIIFVIAPEQPHKPALVLSITLSVIVFSTNAWNSLPKSRSYFKDTIIETLCILTLSFIFSAAMSRLPDIKQRRKLQWIAFIIILGLLIISITAYVIILATNIQIPKCNTNTNSNNHIRNVTWNRLSLTKAGDVQMPLYKTTCTYNGYNVSRFEHIQTTE